MKIAGFETHPAADLFPMMSEAELGELAKDIAERGQREAITKYQGKILDGRNRLKACAIAKVQPRIEEWDGRGGSPTAFVMSLNLRRRHLNQSQRAMIAAAALPLFAAEAKARQRDHGKTAPGKSRNTPRTSALSDSGKASELAAQATGVGSRYVEAAKVVGEKAPELAEKVRAGAITLKQAEKQIRKATQLEQVRAYVPPEGEYALIVRDPAWHFDDQLDGSDAARGGTPYPTVTVDEICEQRIPAAADCVLWLWVTNAHLIDGSAARVLKAWGFQGKTMGTWPKPKMGNGHWLRGQTEHAILAVRGNPKVDAASLTTLFPPWAVGEHSEKPAEFFDFVAKHYPVPEGARLEMDSKKHRAGWVTSGAELPPVEEPKKDVQLGELARAALPYGVGTRVRIIGGRFKGRVGAVSKVPKQITDHRYVRLDQTPREKSQKTQMFALKELQPEAPEKTEGEFVSWWQFADLANSAGFKLRKKAGGIQVGCVQCDFVFPALFAPDAVQPRADFDAMAEHANRKHPISPPVEQDHYFFPSSDPVACIRCGGYFAGHRSPPPGMVATGPMECAAAGAITIDGVDYPNAAEAAAAFIEKSRQAFRVGKDVCCGCGRDAKDVAVKPPYGCGIAIGGMQGDLYGLPFCLDCSAKGVERGYIPASDWLAWDRTTNAPREQLKKKQRRIPIVDVPGEAT